MYANRQNFPVLKEIRVEEHDGDVRFFTGSENTAISRMRNKKYAYDPYLWLNCPNFRAFYEIGVREHDGNVFSPEVEIRPLRACAMHPATIIGTVRSLWTWLCGRYHVP